ncbi:MAG: hypothetical protein JXR91_09170, partial [Deltaproteobacteria bacterium]|nr:hypothetical protein [Deltaproteobacteria bacterium]
TVACTEIPIQPLETTPLFAFLKMELQFKGTAAGRCVAKEVSNVKFPKFKKTHLAVKYPFDI